MLNFDEKRFLRIQTQAVALAPGIDELIRAKLRDGAKSVVFLGAGGAGILMEPAYDLLRLDSTFPAFLERPAELVRTGSTRIDESSIVVIPSLSGTTGESIAVLDVARAAGATIVTLTGDPSSPLAVAGDATFTVEAADDTSSETFFVQSLLIALSIMNARGERDDYSTIVEELAALPQALLEAKRTFEPRAERLAEQLQGIEYQLITAAGNAWAEAWYFGMCILEEMQWIRTRPIHAADFFHGTLELVEKGVDVLILKGEDASRPVVERVERFAPRVTNRLVVIDTKDFALAGISDGTRSLVSPVVLATVLERLSAHLEIARRHPLVTRRYYRRLDY